MKKAKKFISLFMLAALISAPFLTRVNAESVSPSLELRGVWISTVLNLDYPSSPTEDVAALKKEATEELDYAQKNGFNAVFFQVRPACDAFYKSSIFPWSSYLTGDQGKAPGSFDPLEFYVSEAHKRGLQLHAWINPFRVTKSKETLSSLAKSNPARKNPSWVVTGADGNLYLNPGIPEVRALVVNGVLEIIKSYKVDGIHLDDYFYPSKNFNDADAFKKYGAHAKNLDEFRRNNVNLLIKNLGAAIKKANSKVSFGVSPSGIWANKKSLEDGSDTSGGQSYFDSYADSRKWVKEKWVDYIAPQIYWNIGN
ncbi:MAG: family 10 glycosylhydrolase, partial [Bacillota bacterium]|nr:family 10 glycosylhydrolase [Bacillota bacterium]